MAIFYVDGKYVDEKEATLPLTDLAILRGYAVFDFLRTYNGVPFHLDEHLKRLITSGELLHLHLHMELEDVKVIIFELLKRNNFSESSLRIILTGGDSEDYIRPKGDSRLIIMVTEVSNYPTDWYEEGAKVITTRSTRCLPGAKSTDYINGIIALRQARSVGAIEAIYINGEGHILEGTTSNIFLVHQDRLVTPQNKILPGITRRVVMELANTFTPVTCTDIEYDMLKECSEVFITSSTKEVVPIIQIDDIPISKKPGPITAKMMDLFRNYTLSVEKNMV